MLGSHDSYSYLNAKCWLFNLFKPFWKCQNKSVTDLYNNYNVRFFDIRLCKKRYFIFKTKNWYTCHGLAVFKQKFKSIVDLFLYMKTYYPEAIYRIILEQCSEYEKTEFMNQLEVYLNNDGELLKKYNYNCAVIRIKKPWNLIYMNHDIFPDKIIDTCCHLFNWYTEKSLWENIKNFKIKYTIKRWAKLYNTKLSDEEINDKTILYLRDYI